MVEHSDLINGLFEIISAIFIIKNIKVLYKDKQVKGVTISPTIFFALWGFWNLYFYPHNGHMLSFYGGIALVLVNSIWVGQAIYYNRKNK